MTVAMDNLKRVIQCFFFDFRIEEELGDGAVYAGKKFRHPLA